MTCTIKVTLNSITHSGDDIGDDWSYQVNVNNRRYRIPLRSGRGRPGRNMLGRPRTWTLRGPCGRPKWVRIEVRAREHDLLFDDAGRNTRHRHVECPAQPGTGYGFDEEVPVEVSEWFVGDHLVTFKFRIEVLCR